MIATDGPTFVFTNAQSVEMALAGKKSRSALYHNNHDRTFTDGGIDIVVENLQGRPTILRPEGGPPNHWISFELIGTKSNRLALNARLRATAGDLVQTSEVLSGGSYLSRSDLRVHFGLGLRERVDKVEVFWPTGKVQTLTNLVADHFYTGKEGEAPVPTEPIGSLLQLTRY
jgi:hypothetical protein